MNNELDNEKKSSDAKADILDENFDEFFQEIKKRIPIFSFLADSYKFKGEILEIGAGSAWLSALISKIPETRKVYALDISQKLLKKIGEKVFKKLEAEDKIEFVACDFSKTTFENDKFNFIVCDAALHHAQSPDALLREMNRVLKNEGIFIAVREPIKSIFHLSKVLRFGRKEIETGATENIYTKKEWRKHFKNAGFELTILEEFNKKDLKTKLLRLPFLKIFNGLLFSRYYFVARKSMEPSTNSFGS